MTPRDAARDRFEALQERLVDLSHRIHAHPELGFEEEQASTWLCELLEGEGFAVEKGVAGLDTAFVARVGSGPVHVAFCAEYDALPGIGHACGHNIIAAMSAGAGIAAAAAADDAGLTVSVIGTPAEEGGGGKIILLEDGVFDGVDAAMMVHPAPYDLPAMPIIAASHFTVRYHGKAAHAAAFPELGINAADALTVAQTAIGLLRQHLRPTDRVHGITIVGGEAPNIVPSYAEAEYIARALDLDQLTDVQEKVGRCFEAGAIATGARLDLEHRRHPYAEMHHHEALVQRYAANMAEAVARPFPDLPKALVERAAGSTDMGNVSLRVPSIHPAIGIESLPAVNHQPEFTAACITPAADRALHDGGLAMAYTALDIAEDADLRGSLTG
jgi:amidohydrolase